MCKLLIPICNLQAEDTSKCPASYYARACGHQELHQFLEKAEKRSGTPSLTVRARDLFSDVALSGCAGPVWKWIKEQSKSADIAELLNRPASTPFKPSALLMATRIACGAEGSGVVRTEDYQGQVCRALILFRADPSIGDRDGVTPCTRLL